MGVFVTGLSPATTYHFRLLIKTRVGSSASKDEAFTTPQLPIVAPLHVRLLVHGVAGHPGVIGTLLGIDARSRGTFGETITVICQRGCAPQVLLTIPIQPTTERRTLLARPILLSATTEIQVDASWTGKRSRYARYAFALVGTRLNVGITRTGCLLASGHAVSCRA